MNRRLLPAACCSLLFLAACSRRQPAPRTPSAPSPGWVETGVASWYGDPYHGRSTANGETYDMELLTAAHRTLPFGAVLRVTCLSNRKSVTVRVNDRGPFVDGRIIDLSRAAAREIDLIRPGTAKVRLDLLSYSKARPVDGAFGVQVGKYTSRRAAEKLRDRLLDHYDPVETIQQQGSTNKWRVVVGRKSSERDAQVLSEILRRSQKDVFVVRID
ncbi:MAG: septal ring lytic transglycosylase RlpA family protein [Candidatus Solibacter usitatus]|nr:septal ring lytic transglycosylase RlpA family protein [Candidatus Solibacter usitatus]